MEKFKQEMELKVKETKQRLLNQAQAQKKKQAEEELRRLAKKPVELDYIKYDEYKTKTDMMALKCTALQAKLEAHINLCNLDTQEKMAKARGLVDSTVVQEYKELKQVADMYLQKLGEQGSNQLAQMGLIHAKLVQFATTEI